MDDRPPLPHRPPNTLAVAQTLRLWCDIHCTDVHTLARVAAGIRALETET